MFMHADFWHLFSNLFGLLIDRRNRDNQPKASDL
jgi:membrane associated rhomboid family serine protease